MFSSYALGPRGVRSTLVILGVAHATASAPRRISPATRSPAIMSASLSDEYEAGQDGRYPTLASHIRTGNAGTAIYPRTLSLLGGTHRSLPLRPTPKSGPE